MTDVGMPRSLLALEAEIGAMVARHDATQRTRDLTRYAADPVGFQRDVLRHQPWTMQEAIATSVRDHPLTVVQSCHGAGKDWEAADLALWWVYARRGFVLLSGPTERQVKVVLMGELRRAFTRAKDLPGELFELALKIPGDEARGVLAFTSNDITRLTGFHAPRLLVILTEAQGADAPVWEGLLANATGADSRFLALGNPLASTGKFYEVCRAPSWQRFKIAAHDHPNVVEQREIIPGAVTQRFIDLMATEYGAGSSIYQARVLGEFPDDAAEALCKRSWCERAAAAETHRRLDEDAQPAPIVCAVDPARYGNDQTVLAVRQGPIIRRLVAWSQLDLMETVDRIAAELRALSLRCWPLPSGQAPEVVADAQRTACRLVVDTVGIGAGVFDRAKQLGWAVSEFQSGQSPTDPVAGERYLNRRAQAFWHLRTLLERHQLALPADPKLFDELCGLTWRVNLAGKIQLEAKDDLRLRLGRSTDRADAVAMALAEELDRASVTPLRLEWG